MLASRVRLHAGKILRSRPGDAWRYIGARLKARFAAIRPEEGAEHQKWDQRLFRAARLYRPPACLGRLVLLQPAQEGPDILGLAESWAGIPCAAREIHTVAGNHETALDEPVVQDLAARIAKCLAEAETKTGSETGHQHPLSIPAGAYQGSSGISARSAR